MAIVFGHGYTGKLHQENHSFNHVNGKPLHGPHIDIWSTLSGPPYEHSLHGLALTLWTLHTLTSYIHQLNI